MTRGQQAAAYFEQGYNCAQAVTLAFADRVSPDTDTLLKMASAFGGGMGRLREVCGAVSGMFLILGLLEGYTDPAAQAEKKQLYQSVQALARSFAAENGSIICHQLLHRPAGAEDPTPQRRTEQYYAARPCRELVAYAAELLEGYLAQSR